MDKSENLFHQNECPESVTNEVKLRIIRVMKFLKKDLHQAEEQTLMQAELEFIFPMLEQYLMDSFLMMVHAVCSSKNDTETFSAFTMEVENLFVLIREQLSVCRISYVIIPCISSIACMMYYVDETFTTSLEILTKIFANYINLRVHILDSIFKTITILQTENLSGKYLEKIAKSILVFIQSILTNLSVQNNVMDNEVFEKSEQQIQSLIMHWISLFISDIDSNVTTEHLPKILNYFIRHLVKVLNFIEYPSAPYCLIVILRTLMSCLSSPRSALLIRKFALEQICFIIINLQKMVNFFLNEENVRLFSNIHRNLKFALEKFGNYIDIDICAKILLIRFMEEEYSDTDSSFSPTPFFRLNFIRLIDDTGRNEIAFDGSARKRKDESTVPITYNDKLWHHSLMLKSMSYELQREDADIIYHYLVFSRSELPFLVDCYFQKVVLMTSVKNNSLRLSTVKQLVPLIEVNNNLLFSRILKIAIRSLILDHSVFVRENILITLGKIVLLYEPSTYAAIFDENFKNILMRVLDVNPSVRKAVINLLKNFCVKNRNHEKVLKILACILSRIQDKNESVRFGAVEILKQLWFTQPELCSTNSVVEIVHLSHRNLNNLIQLFNYIFLINQNDTPVSLFDVCKKILAYVACDGSKFYGENLDNLGSFITHISQILTKENESYIRTYMNSLILPELKKNTSKSSITLCGE